MMWEHVFTCRCRTFTSQADKNCDLDIFGIILARQVINIIEQLKQKNI